jgi:hypothetical protein
VRDTHFEIQIKVGGKNRGERFTRVALQKKATRGNKGKYCIKKRKFLPNESLASLLGLAARVTHLRNRTLVPQTLFNTTY